MKRILFILTLVLCAVVSCAQIQPFNNGEAMSSVRNKINGNFYYLDGQVLLRAPILSPSFLGIPSVPTASPGTNTTQIANTAFVDAATNNSLTFLTASNGIFRSGNDFQLGGSMLTSSTIDFGTQYLKMNHTNFLADFFDGWIRFAASNGDSFSMNTSVTNGGVGTTIFQDGDATKVGIQYFAAGYATTDRSLTDRGYVLGAKTYTGTQTFAGTSFPAAPTLSDGITWVFNPGTTEAGMNFGANAGVPSSFNTNGDAVYNSTDNELTFRINGQTVGFGAQSTGTLFVGLDNMFAVTSTGIHREGNGLKHQRVTTGSIALNTTVDVTYIWNGGAGPFADENYTVTASVIDASNFLRVLNIVSVTASQVVVRVQNTDPSNARTGTLNFIAMHD